MDFIFTSDVTQKLNSLSREIQGEDEHIAQMTSSVNVFLCE